MGLKAAKASPALRQVLKFQYPMSGSMGLKVREHGHEPPYDVIMFQYPMSGSMGLKAGAQPPPLGAMTRCFSTL